MENRSTKHETMSPDGRAARALTAAFMAFCDEKAGRPVEKSSEELFKEMFRCQAAAFDARSADDSDIPF